MPLFAIPDSMFGPGFLIEAQMTCFPVSGFATFLRLFGSPMLPRLNATIFIRPLVRQDPENRVEDTVQMLANILCKKSQNEIAVFLQQGVFQPVTPIGVRITQMLGTIQFDGQPCICTKQIHLHQALLAEWNLQFGVEVESTARLGKRLQPPEQERLGRTASQFNPL